MNNQEKTKASPEERVERMNGIFDRLVMPMILFTAAVFIIFAIIPKLADCGQTPAAADEQLSVQDDFYALRTVLLSDMDGNRDIFESAGYTVVEDSEAGTLMAYRQLDSGAEIIDNLRDSSGSVYSVVYKTDPDTGIETNIMIYDSSLFLVMLNGGEQTVSAVFYDEAFTADISPTDSGQNEVLALVTAESLADLLGQYKDSMQSIVE